MSLDTITSQDEYVCSFIMSILRSLVDDQAVIEIELIPSETFLTLKVRASRVVISTLVGSKGQMARAIRTLLAGSSAKLGGRYAIDLGADPS